MGQSQLSDAQARGVGALRFKNLKHFLPKSLFTSLLIFSLVFFASALQPRQANAWLNIPTTPLQDVTAGSCTLRLLSSFNDRYLIEFFSGFTTVGRNVTNLNFHGLPITASINDIQTTCNLTNVTNLVQTTEPAACNALSCATRSVISFRGDEGGTTFDWVAELNGAANGVPTFTLTKTEFVPGGGDAGKLDSQQSAITSTIITQQTGTFISGVTDNVTSLFSGAGSDPSFNPSGFTSNSSQFSGDFYVQSTGLKRWINDKRLALAQKRRQKHQAELGLKSSEAPAPKKDDTKLGVTRAGDEIVDEDLIGQYNFWIKGSATYYNGEGHTFDGTTFDVVTGVDYRLSKDVIAGMLIGYGRTDFDINDNGTAGDFEADGYSVGPYFGLRLSDNVFVDGLFVYTASEYENSAGTTTGDFDADRFTGALNIRGRYEYDGMIIEPGVGIIYAREKQESYTDSGGTNHSALTIKTGRVSVGPKVTFAPYKLESSQISPWVAVRGEYDFSNQERAATSSLPDLSDFFSARASLGLDTVFEGGSKLSVKGDASGLFSDKYIGLGGQVRYDVPF